jgi:hypothetical protein
LNLTRHVSESEGDPGNRPLTRSELARSFDFCDEQVAAKQRNHRKGALAAFREAALLKLLYAWGCGAGRRRCSMSSISVRTRRWRRSGGSDRFVSVTARDRRAPARAIAWRPIEHRQHRDRLDLPKELSPYCLRHSQTPI